MSRVCREVVEVKGGNGGTQWNQVPKDVYGGHKDV